jgi:hypothetical protein
MSRWHSSRVIPSTGAKPSYSERKMTFFLCCHLAATDTTRVGSITCTGMMLVFHVWNE